MKIDFKITEILTLPVAIMAAISLASGFLLFAPLAILEKIYVTDLREDYGFYIGITFVLSSAILIVNLIIKTVSSVNLAINKKRFYANAGKNLMKLHRFQKAIVYGLLQEDSRTLSLPLNNGAIREMETKFIIGKSASNVFTSLEDPLVPYHLEPWVSDELNKNKDLLEDFQNAFTEQTNKI